MALSSVVDNVGGLAGGATPPTPLLPELPDPNSGAQNKAILGALCSSTHFGSSFERSRENVGLDAEDLSFLSETLDLTEVYFIAHIL